MKSIWMIPNNFMRKRNVNLYRLILTFYNVYIIAQSFIIAQNILHAFKQITKKGHIFCFSLLFFISH